MPTNFRPGALSSAPLRKRLDHLPDPLFARAFATVDRMATIYDGLIAVRENQTPMQTPEANAAAYKQRMDAAQATVRDLRDGLKQTIMDAMLAREDAALEKAGVRYDPPGGDEIRRALREMSPKDRDRAIMDAAERGDRLVLAAVRHAPSPVTIGATTVPFDAVLGAFIERESPGHNAEMENLAFVAQHLHLVAESFEAGSNKLRDLSAEQAGNEGSKAAAEALGKLQAALAGTAPPPEQADGGAE